MINNKIIPYTATALRNISQGKKTVLTGGCFDIFHFGHLFLLQKAKEKGDVLIVALESDEFITHRKKRQPVHSQTERATILSHIDLVDIIIILPFFKLDAEYTRMVQLIHPSVIVITKGDLRTGQKKQQAQSVQGVIFEVDVLQQFSTSNIIKRYETVFGN